METFSGQTRSGLGNFVRAATVIPINDMRGAKSGRFSEGEELLRCKLAACYRLVDLIGWTSGIYNHITLRCPAEGRHSSADNLFLINPFGLLYSEITASSLLKVDIKGNIIEQGTSEFGFNKAGFTLHSAIHEAFHNINCVIHLHTPAAVAVSAMKCGFLPLGEESFTFGSVSYHEYSGILIDEKEKKLIAKNLGKNKILVLRNHGVAACGETIEEAFYYLSQFMAACETQVRAVALGLDNIVIPNKDVRGQAKQETEKGRGTGPTKKNANIGELEFEAMMRALDNLGYRTGYNYKLLPMAKSGNVDK